MPATYFFDDCREKLISWLAIFTKITTIKCYSSIWTLMLGRFQDIQVQNRDNLSQYDFLRQRRLYWNFAQLLLSQCPLAKQRFASKSYKRSRYYQVAVEIVFPMVGNESSIEWNCLVAVHEIIRSSSMHLEV